MRDTFAGATLVVTRILHTDNSLFAQGGVTPYPFDPSYQLGFFWFFGVLELVIVLALIGIAFNQYRLHRGRFILLAFLASAQAISYKVIDGTLWFVT